MRALYSRKLRLSPWKRNLDWWSITPRRSITNYWVLAASKDVNKLSALPGRGSVLHRKPINRELPPFPRGMIQIHWFWHYGRLIRSSARGPSLKHFQVRTEWPVHPSNVRNGLGFLTVHHTFPGTLTRAQRSGSGANMAGATSTVGPGIILVI